MQKHIIKRIINRNIKKTQRKVFFMQKIIFLFERFVQYLFEEECTQNIGFSHFALNQIRNNAFYFYDKKLSLIS